MTSCSLHASTVIGALIFGPKGDLSDAGRSLHGDSQQKSRIPQPGKNVWAGVSNGISIHFQSV